MRQGQGRPLFVLSLSIKGTSQTRTRIQVCVVALCGCKAGCQYSSSQCLRRSWVRCLRLQRRIKRTHTMCKHLGNTPPTIRLFCSLWGAHLSQWVEAGRGTNTKKLPDLDSLNHSRSIQACDPQQKMQLSATSGLLSLIGI